VPTICLSPKLHDWYPGYVQTYLERDVRLIKNITDLGLFQRFLRLCAARNGQMLNLSSLAVDCGISQNTVRSWLSLLETSYILFLLKPHHKNFNKRLIKMPKLYFYDPGLACYLLGIENEKQLDTHYINWWAHGINDDFRVF
jgi:predicted AAA+ superfamily ATPase